MTEAFITYQQFSQICPNIEARRGVLVRNGFIMPSHKSSLACTHDYMDGVSLPKPKVSPDSPL